MRCVIMSAELSLNGPTNIIKNDTYDGNDDDIVDDSDDHDDDIGDDDDDDDCNYDDSHDEV